jgi:putative chitinase
MEEQLKEALIDLSQVEPEQVDLFVQAFMALAENHGVKTRSEIIHFLAQVLHESGGLIYLEELATGEDYDYRSDLGNLEPAALEAAELAGTSTGRFYKGHGLIQTTGYFNHKEYGDHAGIDAVANPGLLSEYPHALGSALFFWKSRDLSSYATEVSEASCTEITRIVNGGYNGLDDRLDYLWALDARLD